MIHQRQAYPRTDSGRTVSVYLPPKHTSCIVMTPDGEVSTYRVAGLDKESKKGLLAAAVEHYDLIHESPTLGSPS